MKEVITCVTIAEVHSGRALQQAYGGTGEHNTTDLHATLLNSTMWLEADIHSLTQYGLRTLPTSIADATTPVNGEQVAACVNVCERVRVRACTPM